MSSSKEYTIEYLQLQLEMMEHFRGVTITIETVGRFLCGDNHILAKYPFSEEFLSNIAYNGVESMPAILWCQLKALQ